jgi:hypothetical protein
MGAISQASEADMMNKALQCKDRRIANGVPLSLDALEVKPKISRHFRDCLLTLKRIKINRESKIKQVNLSQLNPLLGPADQVNLDA